MEATNNMASDAPFFLQLDALKQAVAHAEEGMQDASSVVESFQTRLADSSLEREFFKMLNSPIWLEPLDRAGFFSCPRAPEEVQGGTRHPHWPASQYLVRMANVAPNDVANILLRIETDNSSVMGDIVDAALKMPAEIAVTLTPAVCKAIQVDAFGVIFPDATDLCVQWGNNGQEDAAMVLAEALFGSGRQHDRGTTADRERHFYSGGLKKVVPVLTAKRPRQFIDSLCKWLGTVITREKNYTGPGTRENYSWSWRPAIEEHEQNRDYGFPSEMVGCVRQAFEQAIGDGQMTLEEGLAVLDKQTASVFKRLRIHLVNRFAEQTPELARAMMMHWDTYDKAEYKHEYAMLVGQRFPMLSETEQNEWLDWVKAGPNMSWYEKHHKNTDGDSKSLAADRWQLNRLHWIREHLSGEWRDLYQKLVGEFGEPLFADLNSYHGAVRHGFDSPFTLEDISTLPFGQLLDKIDQWQPGQRYRFPYDPQKEGLAGTFNQYLADRAEEVSAQAELLKNRQPLYVRTFINAMTDALNAGNIEIGPMLRLCTWVVEQPIGQVPIDEGTSWDMVDRDWQWTRDAVCRFLRAICERPAKDGREYVSFELRDTIVALLEQLARDRAKYHSVDEPKEKTPQIYDFLDSAINSPRGKAVDALIAYARWAARHLQREEGDRKRVPNGFGDMPEVQKMLEWQIAAENACFESFAVIGTYVGLLYWIDHSWVEAHAPTIFNLEVIDNKPERAYGWAAWNGFLVWGQPTLALYQMLRSQYAYAVERLPKANLPEDAGRTPLYRLGEQLILLYGRGSLAKCGDEALLYQFLKDAPVDVRSEVIAFVGHAVSHSETLPADVLTRFQDLWDRYWPDYGTLDARARPQSGLFGQWFTSKQFPDEWSLERLEQFLRVVAIPEFAERIAERLAELAETHLETVMRILDRMIRADNEGWRAYAWRKPAETILGMALRGNNDVRGTAVRLIDDLGRRGYVEFGKLLSPDAGR